MVGDLRSKTIQHIYLGIDSFNLLFTFCPKWSRKEKAMCMWILCCVHISWWQSKFVEYLHWDIPYYTIWGSALFLRGKHIWMIKHINGIIGNLLGTIKNVGYRCMQGFYIRNMSRNTYGEDFSRNQGVPVSIETITKVQSGWSRLSC